MTRFPRTTPYICYPLYAMKPRDNKVLYVPEAIHHYGGLGMFKISELEMAFKADYDFKNVVDAWNFVMELVWPGT